MNGALEDVLRPLSRHYDRKDVIEVRMSQPEALVVDRRDVGKKLVHVPGLTQGALEKMCQSLANSEDINFNTTDAPQLSCVIPGARHRFECALGPSVQNGVSLAVRCKHDFMPEWTDIGVDEDLQGFLNDSVGASRNIIISGAANTGKTTLLNKLLHMVPESRRVVAMEDTPEVSINRFYDGVGLVAGRTDGASSGMLTWRQLYDHSMRITPDHIVFGEISTQNAYAALGVLNTGTRGFLCTIHAHSPWQALHRKFDHNIAWAGQTMPRVPEFLVDLIDLVIQISRDGDGIRRISHVYEPHTDTYRHGRSLEVARTGAAAGRRRGGKPAAARTRAAA